MSIEKLRAKLKEQHRAEAAFGNVRAAHKIILGDLRDRNDPTLHKTVASLARCGTRDRGPEKNRYDCKLPICPMCRQREAKRYARKVRKAFNAPKSQVRQFTIIVAAGTDPRLVALQMEHAHRQLKHIFEKPGFRRAKVYGSREFHVLGNDELSSLSRSKIKLLTQLSALGTPGHAIYIGHIHFIIDLDGIPDFALIKAIRAIFPGCRRVMCKTLRGSKKSPLADVERLILYQNKLSLTRKGESGERCWLEPSLLTELVVALLDLGKRWLRFEFGTQPQKRRTNIKCEVAPGLASSSKRCRVSNRVTSRTRTRTSKKLLFQTTGLTQAINEHKQPKSMTLQFRGARSGSQLITPQDHEVCSWSTKTAQTDEIALRIYKQHQDTRIPKVSIGPKWLPPAVRKGIYKTKFVCEDVSHVRSRSVSNTPDPINTQTFLNLSHNMRRYWLVLSNMNAMEYPEVIYRALDPQATKLDNTLGRRIRYKESTTPGGSFQNLAFEAVSKGGGGFRH